MPEWNSNNDNIKEAFEIIFTIIALLGNIFLLLGWYKKRKIG